jgi:hypothetical protein
VVAAWAMPPKLAGPPGLASQRLAGRRLASKIIKAIPGRKPILDRLPFLSCRCAVIVGTDNIRVGDTDAA